MRNNDEVKVFCYGELTKYNTRGEAVRFYMEAMMASEGSEKERYSNIVGQLYQGADLAVNDNHEFCLANPDYHVCKYCGELVHSSNKDELCTDCKETFGHSLYTEL